MVKMQLVFFFFFLGGGVFFCLRIVYIIPNSYSQYKVCSLQMKELFLEIKKVTTIFKSEQ